MDQVIVGATFQRREAFAVTAHQDDPDLGTLTPLARQGQGVRPLRVEQHQPDRGPIEARFGLIDRTRHVDLEPVRVEAHPQRLVDLRIVTRNQHTPRHDLAPVRIFLEFCEAVSAL
ncbi:hypothetical protein EMIT0P12_30131 [Pseudomonas sp. IT-P12]